MKKVVYSHKEKKYIEVEFKVDENENKIYDDSIIEYDINGKPLREKDFVVPDEPFQIKRKQICETCEHNKFNFCTKCGCIIPLKVKFKVSVCPINKWGKE